MSWQDELQHLVQLGCEQHPEATARFIINLEGWSPYPQHGAAPLDAVVAVLPSACRTQARALIAEARACGKSDGAMHEEIIAAHRRVEVQRARAEADEHREQRLAEDLACRSMYG